jgi:hypothetical protein
MQIRPTVLCALLSPSAALPVSFNAARAYAVPVSAGAIAVADFNGDGNLDLAVVDGAGGLSILLGDGKGGLRFAVEYPAGYGTSVAAADFNGDGKADLAVASQEDGVAIFIDILPAGRQPAFVHSCGRLQRRWQARSGGRRLLSDTISVLLGNGDGTFEAAVQYTVGESPSSVAVADFNGDGKPDLAVATKSYLVILLGNGDGSFQPPVTVPGVTAPSFAVAADVNGDGKADLAGCGKKAKTACLRARLGSVALCLQQLTEPRP